MSAKSDGEVDRILAREKPGYTRVARPHGARRASPHAADAGTPDLPALHARVEALGLWDIAPRGAKRRTAAPVAAPLPAPAQRPPRGGRAAPTHHIVTVGHARQHEADPLQTRVVVVSRSKGRIIGEQG